MSYEQLNPRLSTRASIDVLSLSSARNAHVVKAGLLTLVAPIAVFALHLQPVAAILLLLAVGLAAYLILFGWTPGEALAAPLDFRVYAACLAGAIALCLLGGEYHVFFSTWDWFMRDAVLADITLNRYPVFYHHLGQDMVLRAPLGMYMIPAGVGWFLGLDAAHFALLLQNSFIFSVILYSLQLLVQGPKLRFLGLFLLFGPVDVVPHLAESYYIYLRKGTFVIEPHFMMWNPIVWFWSQLPQIFWAPNHTVSGWSIALLILLHLRREIDIVLLGVSSIVLLFWSPLVIIGAAPLLVWRGFRSLSIDLLSLRTGIAALAAFCFAPLLVFLSLDSGTLDRGWLFEKPYFLLWYPAALIFALPQAWIMMSARDLVAPWLRKGLFLSIAILVLMPLYRFGVTNFDNDVAMRCMLAPMFILAFAFCQAAPTLVELPGRRALLTTAVVVLSSMTGLMEIRRALTDPNYAINDCNLLTATEKAIEAASFPSTNYLARVDKAPAWLLGRDGRRLEVERRQCWPGYSLMKGA